MENFIIITDSCSDLNKETRTKFNIDYIPMHYAIDDKSYSASLDWEQLSCHDFYDVMRKGKRINTSQINAPEYFSAFEKYIKDGIAILSISCSSALSSSYKASLVARDELLEKYPNAKINCVDALISSLGEGSLAIECAKKRANGDSLEQVTKWLEDNKLNVNQIGNVDDLIYLKRAGRVTTMSAVFGGFLQIKPLIISDAIGQNFAIEKVKGNKKAVKRIVEMIKNDVIDSEEQICYISHADCLESALDLKQQIEAEVKFKDFYIDYIGPIVGASVGPGTVIVYYVGHKVVVNAKN